MAYLFNSVNSQLDGDQKVDIFGGSQPGNTSQENGGQSSGSNLTVASSGGGGGGSPSSSSSQQKTSSSGGTNPQAVSSAFRAQAQQVKIPSQAVDKAKEGISSANQKLQSEANAYTEGAQKAAEGYKLSEDTLKGASEGNQEAFQKVSSQLGKKKADQYQEFEGLKGDLPAYADMFSSPITAAKEIYASSSPTPQNYSSGAARLDAAILRQNPEFRQIQAELMGSQRKLEGDEKALRESKTKEARDLQDKSLLSANEAAKGTLGGWADQIISGAKQRELEEEAKRAALDPAKIAQEKFGSAADRLREDFSPADPRSREARALAYLDDPAAFDYGRLDDYVNIDRDVDYRELIDQPTASRFNTINSLLGRGGEVLTPIAAGPGDPYSFDQGGFSQAILGDILGRRGEADRAAQSEIDQILDLANRRASNKTFRQNQKSSGELALEELARQGYNQSSILDQMRGYMPDYENLGYVTPMSAEPLSWQQVLSAEEADRLNALSADAGLDGGYAAGAGGMKPEYNLEALRQIYERMKSGGSAPRYSEGGSSRNKKEPSSLKKVKKQQFQDMR